MLPSGANAAIRVDRRRGDDVEEAELISVPDACRFLGVHRNTLYKLIREGELPAFRLVKGGRWKFRRSDLAEWLEDCQARGAK